MKIFEAIRSEYTISTNKSKLDHRFIHAYLTRSYWATNIPKPLVKKSIKNSLCFGVFLHEKQIGFARVISDYATFAYIADVFIIEEHRGNGLSKWLMETINTHPELQGLRRWNLATKDAHNLYQKTGFTPLANPNRFMEKTNPNTARPA